MVHMLLAVLLAAVLVGDPTGARIAKLQQGLQVFEHARPKIESEVGADAAIQLGYRLVQDRDTVTQTPNVEPAIWQETLQLLVNSDVQSIDDLAAGRAHPLTLDRPGLYESFVRSSADGRWLPVAVYVPKGARSGAPLALLLHGYPQTETELLSPPNFRRLADLTGTILIAPWGRGSSDYRPAQRDVYDILEAAQRAFGSDPRHTYLVGYSMGGFGVFDIGPAHPNWSAVLDVSGAMKDGASDAVRFAWRDTPVYVVVGKRDTVIPPAYGELTAAYLASWGVPTSFYEQPDGTHTVSTLTPVLRAAWLDMHSGVVHTGSAPPMHAQSLPKLFQASLPEGGKP